MGRRLAPAAAASKVDLPETLGYRLKNRLLGPPLVNEQLSGERLGRPSALGVLAPDCISSSAYGSEQMLTILVPAVGLAGFVLRLPTVSPRRSPRALTPRSPAGPPGQ